MSSFNEIAIERFLRSEFTLLPSVQRQSMLDLGCGTRPYFSLYNGLFQTCIAGDYDVRGPINVRLDATNLPFSNASFDLVLMSEVIEHLQDPERALLEIGRVLKPDGILLITWPFNYMMHEVPHDFVRFTEFGMENSLKRASMSVENLFRRGNAITLVLALLEYLVMGFSALVSRVPLIGRTYGRLVNPLVLSAFRAVHKLWFAVFWQRMYAVRRSVGSDLAGPLGHLSLWTLGYCARARKSGG